MKLSNDAIEALILVGGFAIVALIGAVVFFVWPTNLYGNWRIYMTLLAGAAIAVPCMLALRKRFIERSGKDRR